MTNTINGQQPRKTLASQLDRLDTILDTLGNGLNEVVGSAVEQAVGVAVREAVKGVMTQLLTSPEALALLRAALVPPEAPAPQPATTPMRNRIKEGLARAWGWTKGCLGVLARACGAGLCWAGRGVAVVWDALSPLGRFRGPLVIALGMGTVAGALSWLAGPWLAGVWGWLGGFATTLAVQARNGLRRLLSLNSVTN